jgi:hypothetical protein
MRRKRACRWSARCGCSDFHYTVPRRSGFFLV